MVNEEDKEIEEYVHKIKKIIDFINSRNGLLIIMLLLFIALGACLILWKKDINNCISYYQPLIKNCTILSLK